MAETVVKVNDFTVDITDTPVVVPTTTRKKLRALRLELQQAKDSLVYVKARQAEERAPIVATIALMQARFDAAKALVAEDPADEVVPTPEVTPV